MNTSETTRNPIAIIQWTEKFEKLYENADKYRYPEEFWAAVMAHLSHIGEAIRLTNYPDLLRAAAHAFVWMCAYTNHCSKTTYKEFLLKACLSEIVGLKYPTICGHCMRNVCACDSVFMNGTQDKSARYNALLEHSKTRNVDWRKYTTANWLRTFWDIYSVRIHLQPIETIGFHLLEEAGEEALAIRELIQFRGILSATVEGVSENYLDEISTISGVVKAYEASATELKKYFGVDSATQAYRLMRNNDRDPAVIRGRLVRAKMNMVIELADTFSWLCAVLLKVKKTIEDQGTLSQYHTFELLETVLRKEYGCEESEQDLTCYACGEKVCDCLFFPEIS